MKRLANFEVEDVHNYICSAIQQNDVPSDKHMRAIGRRRRQPSFKVFRAGLQPFLETRRERAAHHELSFQSRGQLIPLRQARRKMILVLAIPSTHRFAVMVLVIVFALIAIIVVLIVAFSVSLSLVLSESRTTRYQTKPQRRTEHPLR
jgi:hypothetical protein